MLENISMILGMLSPFVTLFMGWIFETREKKREREVNERKAELELINAEIEKTKVSLISLESKLKACQKVHDTETIENKVGRVIYIHEKTLAYCLALGKLSKMIGRLIIENPDMYPTLQTEIKDVYKAIVSYDNELHERLMNTAMKSYKEE